MLRDSPDHFPFREAIPAPTAVTRISQITADIAESAEALRAAAEAAAALHTGKPTSSVGPIVLPATMPAPPPGYTGSLGRAASGSSSVQQRDSWTSTTPRVTFALEADRGKGEARKSALKQGGGKREYLL